MARISEEEVCGYFPLNRKIIKISVSDVNAHWRVASAVEDFNNEVDRRTQSWIAVNISLQPPWSSPNGLKAGHGGRNKVYPWDWQHGLLLTMASLPWPHLSAQAASRDQQ